MQLFRLVKGGAVDKMIMFDTLPDWLMKGVRAKNCEGLPRSWARWILEKGSVQDVFDTTTQKLGPGDYKFTHTKKGDEPCTFLLDYTMINTDIEKWKEIERYVRRVVNVKTRLMDRLEDMALPMARDSHSELSIEPEDIPVIMVPSEEKQEERSGVVAQGETIIGQAPKVEVKKRGRPAKKVAVTA